MKLFYQFASSNEQPQYLSTNMLGRFSSSQLQIKHFTWTLNGLGVTAILLITENKRHQGNTYSAPQTKPSAPRAGRSIQAVILGQHSKR